MIYKYKRIQDNKMIKGIASYPVHEKKDGYKVVGENYNLQTGIVNKESYKFDNIYRRLDFKNNRFMRLGMDK